MGRPGNRGLRGVYGWYHYVQRLVFARDNCRCRYCGCELTVCYPNDQPPPKNVATLDHLVPLSAGGRTIPSNLVAACPKCNALLGDFSGTFEEKQVEWQRRNTAKERSQHVAAG